MVAILTFYDSGPNLLGCKSNEERRFSRATRTEGTGTVAGWPMQMGQMGLTAEETQIHSTLCMPEGICMHG
ncbi:unnamed protein product [Protopolystoma xenopodis]|uniref:Uncharacterized protein n=1 Tax=Protopolystoma xenopodis TaxID=117903 RepID=A0A448X9N0_9PLAT|nr:unnamed protein product [Protopolystoma xenopodis]